MQYYFLFAVLLAGARGEPGRVRRIIDGKKVPIENYRYMVSVRQQNTGTCGGIIISDVCVLTAAHCANTNKIFSGSSHRFTGKKNLVDSVHYALNDGDVAILKVKDRFVESENTTKIRLSDKFYNAIPGTLGVVAGWGQLSEYNENQPKLLRAVQVPIVGRKKCRRSYRRVGLNLSKTRICAGYFNEGGKDSCKGDSGGPLVIDDHLYAMVSTGFGCALPTFPGVYEKISFYVDWIKTLCDVDSDLPSQ